MDEKTKEKVGIEIHRIRTVLPYLCLVLEDIQVLSLLKTLHTKRNKLGTE